MHSFFKPDSQSTFRDNFYQILQFRKSIRQFKPDPIPHDILKRILESAAMHAPSGKNRQNWRFIVLEGSKRDEYLQYSQKSWFKIKDILEKRLKPSLYAFTERFFYTLGQAPVIVLVYSENSPDEKDLTSIGSVYMAVQNLNLACVVEGLGCCTMGAPLEIKDEVNAFVQKHVTASLQNTRAATSPTNPSSKESETQSTPGLMTQVPQFGGEGGWQLLCGVAIGIPDHEPPKAPRQTEGRVFWLK